MSENKDIIVAKNTINQEIEALQTMGDMIDESLSEALNLLENCNGRVIITGMGKSGHIGRKIAATMASTGTPSFFIHPGEASHGDLGMLSQNDVVIAISNGGESKELSDILLYCKRYGIPLIAVTKNPDSSLGKVSDIILRLPNSKEACPLGLAPTSSTTATLVLGDILSIGLMERKGFSVNDYRQRHPGGKLGAILCKVADLMHGGEELPIVKDTTIMQDALIEMSAKMLGCVGIVNDKGELIGIITDGDLRRKMSPDLISENVTKVMTVNPKTISPNVLAVEAVHTMQNTGNGITNLFVIEDKKPIGVIHIHDCLRAGVI